MWGVSGKIKPNQAGRAARGETGGDGAVSMVLPLQPPLRVPLQPLCPLGFGRFSGLLSALGVRDLLLPAGKWRPIRGAVVF